MTRTAPKALVSKHVWILSARLAASRPRIPALLIRMSSRPKSRETAAAAERIEASEVMSSERRERVLLVPLVVALSEISLRASWPFWRERQARRIW